MPALTQDEVVAAPWRYSPDQWQSAHGVYQPMIGEISTVQYSRMSGRGKRQYEAKRAGEWQASMDCKQEYRAAVIAAYVAGQFHWRDAGVSSEAKSVAIAHDIEQKKLSRQAALDALHEANKDVRRDDLKPGMWICTSYHAWIKITKVNKVSVSGEWRPGQVGKDDFSVLRWVDYRMVEQALDAGLTVRELHARYTARMGWVGFAAMPDALPAEEVAS